MELTGPWSGKGKMRTWGWVWTGDFSIDLGGDFSRPVSLEILVLTFPIFYSGCGVDCRLR